MKRIPLVVANWKMHGQKAWVEEFLRDFLEARAAINIPEIVICPPNVYLGQLQRLLAGSATGLGAQNLHGEEQGAFTGEVSAPMLTDFDCSYAIVGHSERRTLFGESDSFVAGKCVAAQKSGLIPILCVGENAEERERGLTEKVVQRQLDAVLSEFGIDVFGKAVVAYEPVWAIGTGNTATPAQAQAVHRFIRRHVAAHNGNIAGNLKVLYGGSVKADNAVALAAEPDIDGALVGGASLAVKQFIEICRSFDR
jgi:triosephosphate isomerase